MNSQTRPTILFDIDGTLLRTRGAGKSAINTTFQELFGIDNEAWVPVAGRTDYAILGDLFQANGIDFAEHYEAFTIRYHQHLKLTLRTIEGEVLPGVFDLLEQLKSANFSLGIVTGNARVAAWSKLERFGLDSYFDFGGYGDNSRDRNVVAADAVDAASRELQNEFQIQQCWVIGDTPADVACAKSVGAKAVAVLTGGYDHNDFDDSSADAIVKDLTHLDPNQLG